MAKQTIGAPTVIRLLPAGTFCVMNNKEKGMRSYGVEFKTLGDLLDGFDLVLGAHGADEHGPYIQATPPRR